MACSIRDLDELHSTVTHSLDSPTTLQCSFATGPADRTSAACKALEASDPEMGAPFPDVEDLERRQLTRKWVPSMRPGVVE